MTTLYRAPSGVTFTDREALDRAYDVEGAVDDFGVYVDFFVGASATARDEHRTTLGVQFGPTVHETLDIFHGEPGGPVVVFIHGGWWSSLSSSEFSFVAKGLVERGATVVVPNYALAPTVTIDEIVRQMRTMTAWVHGHIAEHGGDPNRIVLTGHSAGGHLTTMLLCTDWQAFYGIDNPISAAVAISGIYDLRPIYYVWMQRQLQFTGEEILRNSPALQVPEASPKLLVTLGLDQPSEFERQALDFVEAWKSAGHEVEYWGREGLDHFAELRAFGDADGELVERILGMLD
ncbi:MAG: alpha/beta hydrolase [Pseudoclavibacter sp.]